MRGGFKWWPLGHDVGPSKMRHEADGGGGWNALCHNDFVKNGMDVASHNGADDTSTIDGVTVADK
eukprot:TRINITY_DN2609_c0_g1_i1.p3 TRINITY_DN2609_c0_g1~~TRINITY_DN2609_c0_g1_i1.p3  ORF type:complete len:65 (+),score=4.99 TRINITY_DN2609_c0_g1_i1:435-629(+)